MTETDKNTLPFLMASLQEVQVTVRAYDTKAQIVGVGYIFAIDIIINLGARVANMPEMGVVKITLAWLVFIFPIALFGAVLYPSRKVAPRLGEQASLSSDRPFGAGRADKRARQIHAWTARWDWHSQGTEI